MIALVMLLCYAPMNQNITACEMLPDDKPIIMPFN